ncbi:glycine zipper 2TM domain-containing protein [Aliiglaciecola litoralis]|uniref:Glycine zipper 2TM domain-containing protein n=1 Tax=Aliiglaciecola litoralis TaxID=582857 RepID=A0ABP3WNN3_9ALTE
MLTLKRLSFAAITATMTLTSTYASANSYYDYARVVKAKPVYQYVKVSQPIKQCYPTERRVRQQRRHHHDNASSTIAGAVVGGIIGGVIGDNRESTLAGAVIGGAIGHSQQRHGHRSHARTEIIERCETVYGPAKKVRKLTGYKVKYRYQGQAYKTFMRTHPGDSVKVRVSLSPVGYD